MIISKKHVALIVVASLVLIGCIGVTAYLLFSNYQNVLLFKQAEENFIRGDEESLNVAELQLQQIIRNDNDNESAYFMLAEIARKKKIYPELVYYSYMAYRLNPLSSVNKEKYIEGLCFARYFDRLETFLAQDSSLSDEHNQLLLYAAGRNGKINKYKQQLSRRGNGNRIGELALLLFVHNHLTKEQKLAALEKFQGGDDAFLQQEIIVSKAELYLSLKEFEKAENALKAAYDLNTFAFAPALGRFYANFRTFGMALAVFEKHLVTYHDPAIAIQTAEFYCLLKQTDRILQLRTQYQSDAGNSGMLCSYYFDALIALAKNDPAKLKELVSPLRQNINTPLSAFMFLCSDLYSNDISAILASYTALIEHRSYLDLQKRADNMVADFLRSSLNQTPGNEEKLLLLAQKIYSRNPDAFSAKMILLLQKKRNSVDVSVLNDALKRFSNDYGILKIGIEYYLNHSLEETERLISLYKKDFSSRASDIVRYEIILALKRKDNSLVSKLFQENLSAEILPEYWTFASTTMREEDLLFLSRNKMYEPFCNALLQIKKGEKNSACDLLEKADANGNSALLFFAAMTLAENGRNLAALKKYKQFPENSPYRLSVLLNMSELYSEIGNLPEALVLSRNAYNSAPDLPETQLCYADKLSKNGCLFNIPDIIKLSDSPYRREMEKLWVSGMQARINALDINSQQEKIREICRQLLVVVPDNSTAQEMLKKLNKMPQ